MLTVLVRDNGRGIRETGRRSGLRNMADRAEQLGGQLRVSPADGGGTELEWRVPVPARGAPAAPLTTRAAALARSARGAAARCAKRCGGAWR